jgi:hypothetical protein
LRVIEQEIADLRPSRLFHVLARDGVSNETIAALWFLLEPFEYKKVPDINGYREWLVPGYNLGSKD